MDKIQYQMKSRIGRLYLVASQKSLEGVYWSKQSVRLVKTLDSLNLAENILLKTIKQLEEYFFGKRKSFDLSLDFVGTSFQKQVWRELSKIPFGKTVSYKDIAKRINNPRAVRAVGTANGKNPLCIIIPCHRVIASDGSIAGYAGGVSIKEKLLDLERNYS